MLHMVSLELDCLPLDQHQRALAALLHLQNTRQLVHQGLCVGSEDAQGAGQRRQQGAVTWGSPWIFLISVRVTERFLQYFV